MDSYKLQRLINHIAILNLAIAGDAVFRKLSNTSWAMLPDELVALIQVEEEKLINGEQWPCVHGKSPDEQRCEVCNGDGIWADVAEVPITEALECMKTEFRNE